MRSASVMALAIAFVGMSLVADKSALFVGVEFLPHRPYVFTGTITQWRPGESITVANGQNRDGFELGLQRTTIYEGGLSTMKPGIRVTVWYRNVGERRLVVDKVRVLDARAR